MLINGQVVGDDNFSSFQGQTTETIAVPYAFTAGQTYNVEVQYQQGGGGWDARLEWSSASQTREFVSPGTAISANHASRKRPADFAATGVSGLRKSICRGIPVSSGK